MPITCPECGALCPDGSRNCRECYHPFGLDAALANQEAYAGGVPCAAAPTYPPTARAHQPPAGVFRPPQPEKRKALLALGATTAALAVLLIFLAAWFLTQSGGGPSRKFRNACDHMLELQGWKAEVRVDSEDFPMDEPSFYLGQSWLGELVYQGPDRSSLLARSLVNELSFETRIIEDTLYEWDSMTRVWRNLGEAEASQKGMNPIWNDIFTRKLSMSDEGTETVNDRPCAVLGFDQDLELKEGFFGEEYEVAYHYSGKIFVDELNELVIAMDYVVEIPGMGQSHYRYDFGSFDFSTTVEVPPGAVAPTGGG